MAVVIADRPVTVQTVAKPHSSSLNADSNARELGVPKRPYVGGVLRNGSLSERLISSTLLYKTVEPR